MAIASVLLAAYLLLLSAGSSTGDLKSWFDSLKSRAGAPCCSSADGYTIEDAEWRRTQAGYEVRIQGQWIPVPHDALVIIPNKAGVAVVWPIFDGNGIIKIKCFLPGVMS